jgi:site-specific DNA-methyltransferase (adenine-specific)
MINQIIHGDCFEVLKTISDSSIDLILTDPPYGLSFMGKNWDHGVPGVQFWIEALRVAKPGAHLFAFGGTRTFHRLAVAIEDAGWEIRDTIMWVYGSGFPKSLDVSKAIDKIAVVECPACNGTGKNTKLESWEEWIKKTQAYGGTRKEWERLLELSIVECPACNGTGKVRGAEREVVATIKKTPSASSNCNDGWVRPWAEGKTTMDLTAPATPEAKQWQGWGTALKPAFEPIIVARKPLAGTVAENVLQWGTGGINIDGCRVGTDESLGRPLSSRPEASSVNAYNWSTRPNPLAGEFLDNTKGLGRWPANFIHDGSEEVVGLFPYQKSGKVKPHVIKRDKTVVDFQRGLTQRTGHFLSSEGSAARFFYCAKASKSERGEGNTHPTVKPLALMKYLITLGLPPGGTVLDPFCGSGTTALACKELGRNYICIEKELEYYRIACNRLDQPIELILDEPIEEIIDNSPLQLKLF